MSGLPCTSGRLEGLRQPSARGGALSRSSAPVRRAKAIIARASEKREVTLLDYGAGNVRSVRNAIHKLGYTIKDVSCVKDIENASRIIFPGVGACGQATEAVQRMGYREALIDYLKADRPFLGICLGMQILFDGSTENGGVEGLGVVPGTVRQFDTSLGLPVPHIGWNNLIPKKESPLLNCVGDRRVYFVHSFAAFPDEENKDWVLATGEYAGEFVSTLQKGNVYATQWHPEKSGAAGLDFIHGFLDPEWAAAQPRLDPSTSRASNGVPRGLAKRVIACLDVRANDHGDLVVTKGDQYDVRESADASSGAGSSKGEVRNLGKPVELAGRYFEDGADEVTFLNITGFRDSPVADLPMLEVLRQTSRGVFVPLTVGGGIRSFTDAAGVHHPALEVAGAYFRSGADKVSIGGDAVLAAEAYYARGGVPDGSTAIEAISTHYGAQAVVVSIDPRRVYVRAPEDTEHVTVETATPGPNGERYCWWQCTVRGGREGRDVDAVQLARCVAHLGAGEILLNCIDRDGAGSGFDLELVKAVSDAVTIPVIASSGAGRPSHFSDVFRETGAAAALAAGIFHRREVAIAEVKADMARAGIPVRQSA
ncbi:HIS7 [Auxenochlorella protothecoides x Auxenochlorella symbiontica]